MKNHEKEAMINDTTKIMKCVQKKMYNMNFIHKLIARFLYKQTYMYIYI